MTETTTNNETIIRNYRKMCLGNFPIGFVVSRTVVVSVNKYLLSMQMIQQSNCRSLQKIAGNYSDIFLCRKEGYYPSYFQRRILMEERRQSIARTLRFLCYFVTLNLTNRVNGTGIQGSRERTKRGNTLNSSK